MIISLREMVYCLDVEGESLNVFLYFKISVNFEYPSIIFQKTKTIYSLTNTPPLKRPYFRMDRKSNISFFCKSNW
jgi:hypothetical protein